jgi:hypothetical protein
MLRGRTAHVGLLLAPAGSEPWFQPRPEGPNEIRKGSRARLRGSLHKRGSIIVGLSRVIVNGDDPSRVEHSLRFRGELTSAKEVDAAAARRVLDGGRLPARWTAPSTLVLNDD